MHCDGIQLAIGFHLHCLNKYEQKKEGFFFICLYIFLSQIEMLEYRQNRLGMEPLQCNEITPSSASLDSLEFRRVQCKGVFDEEKTINVGPRSRSISGVSENGYYLVTPFKPIPENSDR